MLAHAEAMGEEVDPESRMSQQELMIMMGEASLVIDSLKMQEREIQYFQMGQVKRIKCPYCEHKGQSVLEEQTPIYAYLLCFALYILVGFYAVILMPCIAGILRD